MTVNPRYFLVLVISALALSACGEASEFASTRFCRNEGTDTEICITTQLSQPVELFEPIVQTVTVTTRANVDSILVTVESDERGAVVHDGPTEFRLSTNAGVPKVVTTRLRIVEEGFFTFTALAAIDGVTDPVASSVSIEMTRSGGTRIPCTDCGGSPQTLIIWPTSTPRGNFYVVQKEDSLLTISLSYGITVEQLIDLNLERYPELADADNLHAIQPGWVLRVPDVAVHRP